MESRFRRFILFSILIHVLLFLLFGNQKNQPDKLNSLTVEFSLAKASSSSSGRSSSSSASAESSKQFTQKEVSQKKSSTPKTSAKSSSSKTPSLIRNSPPPGGSKISKSFHGAAQVKSVDKQITLNKSKVLTPGSSRSIRAEEPSVGGGQGNEGGNSQNPKTDFGEKSVFGKTSSGNSDNNFELKSGSGKAKGKTGGESPGGSSADSNQGFNWKGTGQRKLVSKNDLVFPKSLEGKGIDDKVVVAFKVAPDGKVYEIDLIRSSGYSLLDNAVKDQVRSFRFNSINSDKVNEAEYNYVFKLNKR